MNGSTVLLRNGPRRSNYFTSYDKVRGQSALYLSFASSIAASTHFLNSILLISLIFVTVFELL